MIHKAIIVHGPGRSGTSLLSSILSLHPSLGWISGYNNRFPRLPILAALNRIQEIKLLERFTRGRKKWPRPDEAYIFWNNFFSNFSDPTTHAKYSSTSSDDPIRCIETIKSILRYSGKSRFITKLTGLPRAAELAQVFENPFVIYINRDPRAVVMSYYKQRWDYKDKQDLFNLTSFETLIEKYAERYTSSLKGIAELKQFRFLHVKYEKMVADRIQFFDKTLKFSKLERSKGFFKTVNSWNFREGTNEIWKKKLAPNQINFVEAHLRDIVKATGYE